MSAAAAPGAEVAAAAPPAKGKKKLIIIIAAVLLLAVAGGGGAVFYMKKKAAEAAAAAEAEGDSEDAGAHGKKKDAKHDVSHVPTFLPLEPFIVNLADKETDRYAQIGITLEIEDAKISEQLKAYMPAIRNGILMVLAHKTSAEVLASEGKVKLAGEIQRATSRALGVDVVEPGDDTDAVDDDAATSKKKKRKRKVEPALPVVAVHFSNFIVQ